MNKAQILEDRLIDFSSEIIKISLSITNSFEGKHLSSQLTRSGTSASLNYGEAEAGESRKDFVHKMKIALKELRETFICLKLIRNAALYPDMNHIEKLIEENNELISIFVVSIKTATKNMQ